MPPDPPPRPAGLRLVGTDPVRAELEVAGGAGSRELGPADDGRVVPFGTGTLLWATGTATTFPNTDGPVAVAVFAAPGDTAAAVEAMGRRVAAARRAGQLVASTDLLVVGDPPRPSEWGLRALIPGATLSFDAPRALGAPAVVGVPGAAVTTTGEGPDTGRRPRTTLVLGGAGSGKSAYAELLLTTEAEVSYLATGRPAGGGDAEWDAKVRAHRGRRPAWWRTVEVPDPGDLAALLELTAAPVLWDSVGTWLTATLDACGAWEDAPGWRERAEGAVSRLVTAWSAAARDGSAVRVAVAEEVGWGVVPATPAGRLFQHELGRLNQRLAAAAEAVRLVVAGRALDLTRGMP